jgi:SAM-dependent methyltransferase
VLSDADAAALYDLLNPWDGTRFAGDAFYDRLVMSADAVLDVGCGTGSMLAAARRRGHAGRLVGVDPDAAALARARRYPDIEWQLLTAAELGWREQFDLAVMVSHAFQCLITDAEVSASLVAIRRALRPGGVLAFETRHPQARAWASWSPEHADEVTDGAGRTLRIAHRVESVVGDVVTLSETTRSTDGTVLRVDRSSLRFLDVGTLNRFLDEAWFTVAEQYGDWDGSPVSAASREIITLARRDRAR